jgi:hypothetical protein
VTGADLLTNSSTACWRQCPRKYLLRYELGVRPDGPDEIPLATGSAYHLAHEMDALGHDLASIAAAVRGAIPHSPLWAEIALRLFVGHRWRWQNDGYEIVESEATFDLPIVNPETSAPTPKFRRGGKRDRIVRIPDGRLALLEFKTTSDDIGWGSPYWMRLQLDPQVSGYLDAARLDGHDVDLVIYDVVKKPSIRPRMLTAAEQHRFRHGADAVDVKSGEWYGESFDPAADLGPEGEERETDEMLEARRSADDKPKARARKLKPDELDVFRNGRIEQGLPAGHWCGESFDPESLVPNEDDEVRETPSMFGARLNLELAESPEETFRRLEVPRTDDTMLEYLTELWWTQQAIAAARRTSRWPRNPNACMDFRRACEYLPLCAAGTIPDPETPPNGLAVVDQLHPELTLPDPAAQAEEN